MKNWFVVATALLGFASCGVRPTEDSSVLSPQFGPPPQYAMSALSIAQKIAGGFLGQGLTLTVVPDNVTPGSTSVNVYVCSDFWERNLSSPSWGACSKLTVSSPGSTVTRTLIVPQFSPRNPNMRVAIYAENYDTVANHSLVIRVGSVIRN